MERGSAVFNYVIYTFEPDSFIYHSWLRGNYFWFILSVMANGKFYSYGNKGKIDRMKKNRNIQKIAGNLKRLRKKAGYGQGFIGQGLGVTYQQVQKFESGKNRISADQLFTISRILKTNIKDLYEGCE